MVDEDPRAVVEELITSLHGVMRLFDVDDPDGEKIHAVISYLEIMHGKMLTGTPLEAEGRCDCGGNLSPYDPEGAPKGTYPGNYQCDGCDKISQKQSETVAGVATPPERIVVSEAAGIPLDVIWEPITEFAGVPVVVSDELTKPNIVPGGAGVNCPECGEECRLWNYELVPACAKIRCSRWGKALDDGRDLV